MCIQHLSALSCQTCIDARALCWSFWEGLHALQMAAASQRCSNLLMTDLFEVFCAGEKWTCFQSLVRDRVICHLFDGATGFCRERCSHIYAQVIYAQLYAQQQAQSHYFALDIKHRHCKCIPCMSVKFGKCYIHTSLSSHARVMLRSNCCCLEAC